MFWVDRNALILVPSVSETIKFKKNYQLLSKINIIICKYNLHNVQYLEFHKNSRHKHFQISSEGLDMEGNPTLLDKCLLYQIVYCIKLFIHI